jgi:hypothetical protein
MLLSFPLHLQRTQMEKLSLHRALAELKLIDKKLTKHCEGARFIGYHFKAGAVNGTNKAVEQFCTDAKASYTSYIDLLNRKIAMKAAIMKKNNEATIDLDGKKLTIADAIAMKDNLVHYETIINSLRTQFADALRRKEQSKVQVDDTVKNMITTLFGKDQANISGAKIEELRAQAEEQNGLIIEDPLNIEKKIEELTNIRDGIITKIDYLLSEVNAITFIEI